VDQLHGQAHALLRLVDGHGTDWEAHREDRRAGQRSARAGGVGTSCSRPGRRGDE
jgi:hypothetical protein